MCPDEPIYSLCGFGRRLLLRKSTSKEAASAWMSSCLIRMVASPQKGLYSEAIELMVCEILLVEKQDNSFPCGMENEW